MNLAVPRALPGGFAALCRARERLLDPAQDALPIEAVAREAGLTTGHFIRRYAAVFGDTPHRQRMRARMERAKALLARGCPVTQACMDTGYSSVGSFSALFSRHVGVAPATYRARARTLVALPAGHPLSLAPGCLNLLGLALGAMDRNFRDASRSRPGQTPPPRLPWSLS